jgi:micrococcal nuclease
VTLHTFGKDKYGRTIAEVILPDETNVNLTLVEDGWCWWYRKYAPGHHTLERLEAEPREAKRGLWRDALPVPPWEWRKKKIRIRAFFLKNRSRERSIYVPEASSVADRA